MRSESNNQIDLDEDRLLFSGKMTPFARRSLLNI